MRKNKFLAGLVSFISFGLFLLVLTGGMFYSPNDELGELETTIASAQESDAEHPARLYIPSLKIDANVQSVGVTRKGNMAAPNNFTDVGWYKYGTVPGQLGSAVIAGHVDNGFALPGVFSNLSDLKVGENVYIETKGGEKQQFVVEHIGVYDFNAPTEDIFHNDDGAVIKLITCTGIWMEEYRTHDKRLVVTAKKVR